MSKVTIKAIGPKCELGEGPFWDAETQSLYYVDIKASSVHKYDPATKKDTCIKIEAGPPSFIIPIKGEKNKFVISKGRNLAILTWNGESETPEDIKIISTVDEDEPNNNLNDGKADLKGTLWAGTLTRPISLGVFGKDSGSFYSFADPKSPVKHFGGIGVSNGLVWTRDMKTMYYIDTKTHKVEAFDLDSSAQRLSNRRTIIDFAKADPTINPDGMTLDVEGKLWVASFGKKVVRVDPESGTVMQELIIPSQATAMAFGGPGLDQMYVTTARVNIPPEEEKLYPDKGATFVVTGLGVKGYPGDRVVIPTH